MSRRTELIGGVILIAVGLIGSLIAQSYGFRQPNGHLGPGLMPFSAGIWIALTGLVIASRGLVAGRSASDGAEKPSEAAEGSSTVSATVADSPKTSGPGVDESGTTAHPAELGVQQPYSEPVVADESAADHYRRRKLILVIGLLVAFAFGANFLGFGLAVILLVSVLLISVERKPYVPSITSAVGIGLTVSVVFMHMLNLPLPQGPFDHVVADLIP